MREEKKVGAFQEGPKKAWKERLLLMLKLGLAGLVKEEKKKQ